MDINNSHFLSPPIVTQIYTFLYVSLHTQTGMRYERKMFLLSSTIYDTPHQCWDLQLILIVCLGRFSLGEWALVINCPQHPTSAPQHAFFHSSHTDILLAPKIHYSVSCHNWTPPSHGDFACAFLSTQNDPSSLVDALQLLGTGNGF